MLNVLKQLKQKTEFLIKHIKVERFDLNVTVASGDAATTAIEYGAVCAVAYPIAAFVLNYNKSLKENININCDYNNQNPQIEFCVVASLRLIHLLVLLGILPTLLRNALNKGD